ncbi:MAG: D-glycero-beta-D-manno-heptose 1-phosphate adenylyltransferase [candidate division Zixibacteria bacterium]|nr:D-glycero-beta-D-manno-heptose 1-phosphate adenylyltransferase [candidate division Zixibacteria bacterium]
MGQVVKLDRLIGIRGKARKARKKVVFTNGCFDILHRGHIDFLKKAKGLGDILIVGLNTDSSVKKIKGKQRPIISQNDRAEILANLLPVDYVCLFNEETPIKLISALVPDILVKGRDYKKNEIVGKDIVESKGGKVIRIKLVQGKSTKSIINTVLNRYKR